MEDAELSMVVERITRLCENISTAAQECASPEHLGRILGSLECVFMAGHDDIDYDDEELERRPDA